MNRKAIKQVIQILIFTFAGLIFFSVNTITFNGYTLIRPFDFLTGNKPSKDNDITKTELSSKTDSLLNDSTEDENDTIKSNNKPIVSNIDGKLIPLIPYQMDTTPQRILMVGESMIEGLYLAFKKMAVPYHHKVKAKIWYGSRILDWGKSDTLTQLINQFKPTYIIISVASNELFIKKIFDRQKQLDSITGQLRHYKYVWVGPPIPKRDYGIDSMIRTSVMDGCYYTSKYHKFKRRRDGVHPKREECYRWADSIAVWIETKSRYPIKLIKPKIIKDSLEVKVNKKDKKTKKHEK